MSRSTARGHPRSARLLLIVGLPGAGKTTRSRELAAASAALRLTPDAWMIPLFGESEADGLRDVLEGRLIWTAVETLRLGVDVVLDFGFWGRDERTALRWLATSIGADSEVVYLPVDRATQLERIGRRWNSAAQETFPITPEDLDRWREQFEEPDDAELAGRSLTDLPTGWTSWADWIVRRWPTALG